MRVIRDRQQYFCVSFFSKNNLTIVSTVIIGQWTLSLIDDGDADVNI